MSGIPGFNELAYMNADEVDPATIAINEPLARALWFDAYDLAANRAGYLSKKQLSRLARQAGEYRRYLQIAAVFAVITLVLGIAALASGESGALIVVALLAGLVIAFVGYQVWRWRQLQQDIAAAEVRRVAGRARAVINHYGRGATFFHLAVAGQRFNLRRQAILAFQHGGDYHVYYTPAARVVLAAEPVDLGDRATKAGRKRKRE